MKRIRILFSVVFVLIALSVTAFAVDFDGGDGSEASPYLVSTPEQLFGVAELVNSASGSEYFFSLTQDIDLSNAEWTPIGLNANNSFNGAFYGNGYTVRNVKITQNRTFNGFFGYIKKADVSKLSIESMTIDVEHSGIVSLYIGLLSGKAHKENMPTEYANVENTLSEISVSGKINVKSASSSVYAGGLVGSLYSKSGNIAVSDCMSQVDIDVETQGTNTACVGGVIGRLDDYVSKYTLCVKKSYYEGSINVVSGGKAHCGGIAGSLFSSGVGWAPGWYSDGEATLFADELEECLANCFADGDINVSAESELSVGRIVGYPNECVTVTNCAYLSTQTVSALLAGKEYTSLKGTHTAVSYDKISEYIFSVLEFDENKWEFYDGIALPLLDYMVTTVTFDACGGTNTPVQQKVLRGETVVITSDIPSKNGFPFLGWSTVEGGEVEYAAGADYAKNEDIVLYAVWKEYSGSCGEYITWTLTSDGVLTIKGTGNMIDASYSSDLEWSGRVNLIKYVVIEDGITSIANHAFRHCAKLESVDIPDSVTAIGNSAFSFCDSLAEIKLPENIVSIGDSAFSSCDILSVVELPKNLESIGKSAFDGCAFTSISIPASVSAIGANAFEDCINLESVIFGENSLLTAVSDYVFKSCNKLKNIVLPEEIAYIGASAFYDCTSLESINIPSAVKRIDSYAFSGCSSLSKVQMEMASSQLESIAAGAFKDCTGLASFEIPESVTGIGGYGDEVGAFDGCTNLTIYGYGNSQSYAEDFSIPFENVPYRLEYALKNGKYTLYAVYGGDLSGKLVCVLYDSDGRLVETKLIDAVKEYDVDFANMASGEAVQFMWISGTDIMQPLCESIALNIE